MGKVTTFFFYKEIEEDAWGHLCSGGFPWDEQTLEIYQDKVDWNALSMNKDVLWTPAMLEKFKAKINWHELSAFAKAPTLCKYNLERFIDYWDWDELSANDGLELTETLIDEFRTLWDWERIINRVSLRQLFNMAFYMKYSMQITTDKLGQSVMWHCLVEERVAELSKSLLSKVYGTK